MSFYQPLVSSVEQCLSSIDASVIRASQEPVSNSSILMCQTRSEAWNAIVAPESRCFEATLRTSCVGIAVLTGKEAISHAVSALNPRNSLCARICNLGASVCWGYVSYLSAVLSVSEQKDSSC